MLSFYDQRGGPTEGVFRLSKQGVPVNERNIISCFITRTHCSRVLDILVGATPWTTVVFVPCTDLGPTVDTDAAEARRMTSMIESFLVVSKRLNKYFPLLSFIMLIASRYRGPPRDHHRPHHEPGSRSRSASHSPSASRSRPKGKKSQSRSHSPAEDFHPTSNSQKQSVGRSPSRSHSRSMSRSRSRSRSWAGRKSGGH